MRRHSLYKGLAIALALALSSCGAPDEPAAVITLSASTMSASATKGGPEPAAQTFTILNGGGGTLNWTATDNTDWLSVSPASGSIETGAPAATLTVSINVGALAPGEFTGTITIDGGAGVTPKTVSVTLTVVAQPVIGVSATTFAFTGIQGGSNPSNQTLTITNTGGSTLAWTATKASADWLTLSSSSGSAPSTVTLAVSLAGLAPGNYSGTVTIASTGAANTPQTISVSLVVNQAPAIGLSPTSLTFSGVAGGASPPTQTISVTNTGGSSLGWTASKDAAWLSVSPAAGTAPSTITVTANTAGLAAGTYNGTITVAGTGATNTPQTVAVQLTVTPLYDGTWTGKTSQDSTITITVSGNAITQVVLGWKATGGCTVNGKTTTNFTTPLSVSAGSFSFSTSGTTHYSMSGTFGSANALSGTFTVTFSQAFPSCSASSGSQTFTASKP